MTLLRLPSGSPARFRSTVHGTVFAGRERHVESLHPGDSLILLPDSLAGRRATVRVYLPNGAPVGHLPPEISRWLAPWLRSGGRTCATAFQVGDTGVPSWRRLVLEVRCLTP